VSDFSDIKQSSETSMETNRTVSVIIPTYKRASLIARSINSVLRQTYRDIEVIVVDDGSPDNTGEVVAAIRDERVRYMRHERNKGLPATRNTGIRAASGEYVAFLDDDDEWLPEKLEQQVPLLRQHGAVSCGYVVNRRYVNVRRQQTVSLEELKRGNDYPPACLMVLASIAKRQLFDETLPHAEDWDMLIRLAQSHSIGYVPRALAHINDGDHPRMTNSTKNTSLAELEFRMAILRKHEDFFGPYWKRYHTAKWILSYLGSRDGKLQQLALAVTRCGWMPVWAVLRYKIKRRLATMLQPRFNPVAGERCS
jgi:glycosyltransferase involved in cell wall biosynthesis